MMPLMRTTLTLDNDLAADITERARLMDQSFKQVVNDTLRRGLSPGTPPPRVEYQVKPFRTGLRVGVDPLRLNQLNDALEVGAFPGTE